jgi:hypothetical protein
MTTKLTGRWTNKLFSLVVLKEYIIDIKNTNNQIETKRYLQNDTRYKLLEKNKERLIDLFLILECILRDDEELIQIRSKTLNIKQRI